MNKRQLYTHKQRERERHIKPETITVNEGYTMCECQINAPNDTKPKKKEKIPFFFCFSCCHILCDVDWCLAPHTRAYISPISGHTSSNTRTHPRIASINLLYVNIERNLLKFIQSYFMGFGNFILTQQSNARRIQRASLKKKKNNGITPNMCE